MEDCAVSIVPVDVKLLSTLVQSPTDVDISTFLQCCMIQMRCSNCKGATTSALDLSFMVPYHYPSPVRMVCDDCLQLTYIQLKTLMEAKLVCILDNHWIDTQYPEGFSSATTLEVSIPRTHGTESRAKTSFVLYHNGQITAMACQFGPNTKMVPVILILLLNPELKPAFDCSRLDESGRVFSSWSPKYVEIFCTHLRQQVEVATRILTLAGTKMNTAWGSIREWLSPYPVLMTTLGGKGDEEGLCMSGVAQVVNKRLGLV